MNHACLCEPGPDDGELPDLLIGCGDCIEAPGCACDKCVELDSDLAAFRSRYGALKGAAPLSTLSDEGLSNEADKFIDGLGSFDEATESQKEIDREELELALDISVGAAKHVKFSGPAPDVLESIALDNALALSVADAATPLSPTSGSIQVRPRIQTKRPRHMDTSLKSLCLLARGRFLYAHLGFHQPRRGQAPPPAQAGRAWTRLGPPDRPQTGVSTLLHPSQEPFNGCAAGQHDPKVHASDRMSWSDIALPLPLLPTELQVM